jgi:hypothetical protein
MLSVISVLEQDFSIIPRDLRGQLSMVRDFRGRFARFPSKLTLVFSSSISPSGKTIINH